MRSGPGVLRRVAPICLVASLALAACAGMDAPEPTASGAGARALTVFAAASLRTAMDRVRPAWETAHPDVPLIVSTGSSVAMATQIELGAPADVFLSADQATPARLEDAGLTDGRPVTFARNQLTVVVPLGDPAGIGTPVGLARPGVTVIAAADRVPITRYALQVVASLAREPGYPADFAADYAANVASREIDVQAVLARIELGEGDAAIVYASDAAASDGVGTIDIPATSNVVATYDGAVVRDSTAAGAGREFLDWLAGPDGQAILVDLGFLPVPA